VIEGFSGVARVIVVEANTPQAGGELTDQLEKRGYTLARSLGVNLLFTREKGDAKLLRQARACGTTERTFHPLGHEATLHDTVGRFIDIVPSDE
jgi:hypothetical protein